MTTMDISRKAVLYTQRPRNARNKYNLILNRVYSNILDTANILKQFKRTKVIALLKPGNLGTKDADYHPISPIIIPYKILERFILEGKPPHIDEVIPVEQRASETTEFAKNRSLP